MFIDGVQAANFRRLIEYLSNPFFWVFVILLLLTIYLMMPGRDRVAKRAGSVLLLLWIGFYSVSTPWISDWMIRQLESQYVRVKQVNPNVHWVVVLGGGAAKNLEIPASEALSGVSLKRVFEGVRLYRALPEARLILSGGAGAAKPEFSVARRFDEFADWIHVPKAHRVLEVDSINTADEARFIKPLVGDSPFYLVTSALHMPRAMMLFEKQGLHPIAAPCNYLFLKHEKTKSWTRFLPTAGHIVRFNIAWHEYLGQWWGAMRGKI
jgi:uncharacterized SAM-binding protein YcdF (DUF218 family)